MAFNGSNAVNESTTKAQVVITHGKIFDAIEQDYMKVTFWPLIFVFTYSVLGVIGNTIVIYIYWIKWKKNKTRVFILTLGILDWINCAFNMPVEVAVLWKPISFDMHYLCKISRGCTFVINNTGSLVFLSIAIERFIVVYYPLRNRQLTPKFAKIMCLLAFIFAFSVSWPSFVFYGTHTETISESDVTVIVKTCLIADEHEFRTGLLLIFTTVLFTLMILVFIILLVLYIAIGRKIYIATCTDVSTGGKDEATKLFSKSIISAITGVAKETAARRASTSRNSVNGNRYKRNSMTPQEQPLQSITETTDINDSKILSSSSSQRLSIRSRPRLSRKLSTVKSKPTRKNTVMMRMVTIAFVLSFTPFLCILIIRYSNTKYYWSLNVPGKIVYSVLLRTYFINSMVNPFIYGFMNLHFRHLVKQLFRNIFCNQCCKGKNDYSI